MTQQITRMVSEILIKGMVCERCIAVIKGGITKLGHEITRISLGKLSLNTEVNKDQLSKIETLLRENGFELISKKQVRIVDQAKALIHEVFSENVRYDSQLRFSTLLSERLHLNYDSISELFSELEGITLEKYIITKRLEKVKELLVYTDFSFTEIAYITGFSSISHLSRQFKELTGLSPSHFKAVKNTKQNLAGKTAESNS